MPSPFPGMDPFLESQYFGSLHGKMITYLEESMQDRLPEDYFAISKERVWIDTASWIEPDVLVGRAGNFVKGTLKPSAGVATMAKPVTVAVPLGERTEPFCTIEIPSPSEVSTSDQSNPRILARSVSEGSLATENLANASG